MKRFQLISYTYKPGLDEDDRRHLMKKFVEYGQNPGVVSQFERFDGKGGFVIQEPIPDAKLESVFERTAIYSQFLDFSIFDIGPFDEVLPTYVKLYG